MLFHLKAKRVCFTALISQIKSVTIHATNIALAWRGEINKDTGEGRGMAAQSCRVRKRGIKWPNSSFFP